MNFLSGGGSATTSVTVTLLTEESPRLPTPSVAAPAIKLWPHQEAMLARCVEIEAAEVKAANCVRNTSRYFFKEEIEGIKPTCIGVMNDPPGAGKTYVILSLIARNDLGKLNVIAVPQNIFSQWQAAIERFYAEAADPPPVLFINTYADLADLSLIESARLVLINDVFLNYFADVVKGNMKVVKEKTVHVGRLFLDEVDTIEERFLTPFEAERVWLVSASFDYKGEDTPIGPYLIKQADVPKVVCKCDPAFIAKSLVFEEPVMEVLRCDDADIELFAPIVPPAVRIALYAGDRRKLLTWMGKSLPTGLYTLPQLLTMYVADQRAKLGPIEEEIAVLRTALTPAPVSRLAVKPKKPVDEEKEAEIQTKVAYVEMMRTKLADYEAQLAVHVPVNPRRTKQAVFEGVICERIRSNPASKWLIFNDNGAALIDAQATLSTKGIKAVMLDGGNAAAIERAIASYKTPGGTQVLLLNSMLEGCGMNLENTTDLLFMHATRPRLVEQVVGRAQRFGRVGALRIIGLFGEHETNSEAEEEEAYGKKYFVGLSKAALLAAATNTY
jgi:hypothetical protein